jgi:flagellar basal body rod protein FlgG
MVKGKPKVEPKKVPPSMFQQMLGHNHERTVTIKDKDVRYINKLKVVKLIKNEGLRLDGDTLYCDSCHHKIAYKNV